MGHDTWRQTQFCFLTDPFGFIAKSNAFERSFWLGDDAIHAGLGVDPKTHEVAINPSGPMVLFNAETAICDTFDLGSVEISLQFLKYAVRGGP